MDMLGALRSRLLAAAPVTALVGQRVYVIEAPQSATLPRITLLDVSELRPQHLKGWDLRTARVQIDIWADTSAKRIPIQEVVIEALASAQTVNGIAFQRSMFDSIRGSAERVGTATIFKSSVDILLTYATA